MDKKWAPFVVIAVLVLGACWYAWENLGGGNANEDSTGSVANIDVVWDEGEAVAE